MRHTSKIFFVLSVVVLALTNPLVSGDAGAITQIELGRQIFRFETFGSEVFWGDTLLLHEALATLTPAQALALGLKVDASALPRTLVEKLREGTVNLNDPAVTLTLLRLNAVIGVKGFFSDDGALTSVGFQCSLCHTQVTDSVAPGIGARRDLWANRDLNVGAIIAQAPNLQPFVDLLAIVNPAITVDDVKAVLNSWGPGKFDAALLLDGKGARPDGKPAAVLIPPAFGLSGVNLHTWTGWGSVTYWNAFVANLALKGKGTFFDPRLNNAEQFPIAAASGFGNVRNTPDLATDKMAALHEYELSVPAPAPFPGRFNADAAARGKVLFNGKARCAECHVPTLYTEPGWNMHTAAEIGIDDFQANRAPDKAYRTPPLKGLWTHTKGGFFHDGRFANLKEVVLALNDVFNLGLTPAERVDLIEFLRSL